MDEMLLLLSSDQGCEGNGFDDSTVYPRAMLAIAYEQKRVNTLK